MFSKIRLFPLMSKISGICLALSMAPQIAQAVTTTSWAEIEAYSGSDTKVGLQHTYRNPIDMLDKKDKIIRINGLRHIQTLQQWDQMVNTTKGVPSFTSSLPATHKPTASGEQMVATVTTSSGRVYDLMVPVNMKLYAWYPGYSGEIYLPEETCSDCRNKNARPVGVGHLKPIALVLDTRK